MNKILCAFTFCFVLSFNTLIEAETSNIYTFYLSKETTNTSDPLHIDLSKNGHRSRAISYMCIINDSGIELIGIDKSEVFMYILEDKNTSLCHYFQDEKEFVNYIFNNKSDYVISIYTFDLVLTGYIYN